jgi:cytochrome c oxidase subunit 2
MQGLSNFSQGVDTAFYVIIGISLVFLIGLTTLMIYFVVKYNRKKHPKAQDVKESSKMEILWIVIPTLLVLVMFWYGWIGYRPMRQIPDDAIKVKVTAKMWSWTFEYENGKWDSLLYVPVNKPVALDLISDDVVHSLFIPAFRIKEDASPGVTNKMWFRANQTGEYDILCAEYCGLKHADMYSRVIVLPEEDYLAWYNAEKVIDPNMPPGLEVLQKNGCIACHSTDGSKLVGPSFKGIYGIERTVLVDGDEKTVLVDDEYIIRSIEDPNAEIVKGFNAAMPPYKDKFTEEEIELILDYFKSDASK